MTDHESVTHPKIDRSFIRSSLFFLYGGRAIFVCDSGFELIWRLHKQVPPSQMVPHAKTISDRNTKWFSLQKKEDVAHRYDNSLVHIINNGSLSTVH